jgi:glycosyltransferase involved in cell wall biosynthesis
MTASPTVTVLLPVYNSALFLFEAVVSILNQTYTDFELLCINDGSTDESEKILRSFSDPRVRIENNPHNLGLIATLNKGIDLAQGKYIARMDADDIALPNRLALQVKVLETEPGLALVAGFVECINTDGEVTGVWSTDREAKTEQQIRSLLPQTNCIAHPTVMIRTTIARRFYYNPSQYAAEDWDLWLRILASGLRIGKINDVVLYYRIHPASMTGLQKASLPLELRLMRFKKIFLGQQILKGKINSTWFYVVYSWIKNAGRYMLSTRIPNLARDGKRLLTSSPFLVARQAQQFNEMIRTYNGSAIFIFPYTQIGGAERVHADIVKAVTDSHPLVFFTGFSKNDKFLHLFSRYAQAFDVSHYVNYPLTRKKAKQELILLMRRLQNLSFMGSNAGFFYDMLPLLPDHVKAIDLIHAFRYQPGANLAHQQYLHLMPRLATRVFVSEAARDEFDRFCFHNNMPKSERKKLIYISNAVQERKPEIRPLQKPVHILFVGRNSEEKRLHLFLHLASLLHKKNSSEFHFTVVGSPPDPNYNFIQFMGEIHDTEQLESVYARHDILVVTSLREGFPVVIQEAMMNGLVVLATPVGDIPNRINGQNGIVIPHADEDKVVDEMYKSVLNLVLQPKNAFRIKQQAYGYAKTYFGMDKFQAAYRNLLDTNSIN